MSTTQATAKAKTYIVIQYAALLPFTTPHSLLPLEQPMAARPTQDSQLS